MRAAGIDESPPPNSGRAGRAGCSAGKHPQLLVSVRDAVEVPLAVAGGCDILDVKEPSRGPLGMADLDAIAAVAETIPTGIPLSVALGEMVGWASSAETPSLPGRVAYAKLGLSGASGSTDWKSAWRQVRSRFDSARGASLNWIAVAYADRNEAGAPHPGEVVAAAVETGCAGVLIDTFTKDGRSLVDALSVDELIRLSERTRHAGLLFALAGRITAELLPELAAVPVDVVGIRSAACVGTLRERAVCADAIARFKRALDSSATSQQPAASAAD